MAPALIRMVALSRRLMALSVPTDMDTAGLTVTVQPSNPAALPLPILVVPLLVTTMEVPSPAVWASVG